MSMEGEGVFTSGRCEMSYTPVAMKSASTALALLAHSRRPIGTPMRLA